LINGRTLYFATVSFFFDRSAQSLLDKARRMRPHSQPDGYRIIDGNGTVVVRSWER
jgi:hypothetical protein